jgi:hypothetical protein
MTDIPEWLQNEPYFRSNDKGEAPSVEQIKADLANASKLQGDLSSSHIRIPDANDSDSLTTAKHKAMQHIPGLTVIPTGDDAASVGDPLCLVVLSSEVDPGLYHQRKIYALTTDNNLRL